MSSALADATLGVFLATLRAAIPAASPTTVARELGVARSYIYQLEADQRHPSAGLLGRLLDYYGADLEQRAAAWQLLATAPPLTDVGELLAE